MTQAKGILPRAAEQCRIIQFSSFVTSKPPETGGALADWRQKRAAKHEAKLLELTTSPENLSETCKNSRMRLSRRDAWSAARRLTDYWRARMDWHTALSLAQQYDVAEAKTYAKSENEQHFVLVGLWRTALVSQMLTPAPDAAAVAWKRAQFRRGEHRYSEVKPELLERSIDSDVRWLNDHPTRRT